MLFHVSEEGDIRRFDPRPTESFRDPVVWSIDAEHLRNYLLPRDCPRVTYYRIDTSTDADVNRWLGSSTAVVAIEEQWIERVRASVLYCYHLPATTFACIDAGAGYHLSTEPVIPVTVEVIRDPLRAIADRGADVRVVKDLWPIHDAVAASSLQFSMIRMRNATRPTAPRG